MAKDPSADWDVVPPPFQGSLLSDLFAERPDSACLVRDWECDTGNSPAGSSVLVGLVLVVKTVVPVKKALGGMMPWNPHPIPALEILTEKR